MNVKLLKVNIFAKSLPNLFKGLIGDWGLWIIPLTLISLGSAAFDDNSLYKLPTNSTVNLQFWFWGVIIVLVATGFILAKLEKLAVYTKWDDSDFANDDFKRLMCAIFTPLIISIILLIAAPLVASQGFGANYDEVMLSTQKFCKSLLALVWVPYFIMDFSICYYRNKGGVSTVVAYMTKLAVPAFILLLILFVAMENKDKKKNNSIEINDVLIAMGLLLVSEQLVSSATTGSHAYQKNVVENKKTFNSFVLLAFFVFWGAGTYYIAFG